MHKQKGFMLIELLVVITLIVLSMANVWEQALLFGG